MRLKLKEVLEAKKVSGYRLAKLLEVPTGYVYSWCDGSVTPSLPYFALICKALECEPNDLLGLDA